jgi:hypothetical protein
VSRRCVCLLFEHRSFMIWSPSTWFTMSCSRNRTDVIFTQIIITNSCTIMDIKYVFNNFSFENDVSWVTCIGTETDSVNIYTLRMIPCIVRNTRDNQLTIRMIVIHYALLFYYTLNHSHYSHSSSSTVSIWLESSYPLCKPLFSYNHFFLYRWT